MMPVGVLPVGNIDQSSPLHFQRAYIIPMTCDHTAWSPRAARRVVRDPLRFRAAFTLSEAKGSE
ncbi:MAG: hypothetical protein KatS3mg058_2453 [Roseiflexus sp.]|nr:MAG: hypothetical protein KatS3mg058_2453 [Roseiflexus sp.]